MSSPSFELPPAPAHLAQFPTKGGLVIPFITLQHRNGKAALGLVDAERMELCLRERRCGVCGSVIVDRMVFLMRQIDLQRKCSNEPALCPPCAAYTQKACPMIAGHMAHYRRSTSSFPTRTCGVPACACALWTAPDASSPRLGDTADQWYALWTLHYSLTQDEDGRLAAGFAGLRVLRIREIQPADPRPSALRTAVNRMSPLQEVSKEHPLDPNPPSTETGQFTPDELAIIIETFEVAMQTDGFIDTASGGSSHVEKEALLAAMERIHEKARSLHGQMTSSQLSQSGQAMPAVRAEE
jgi:hypothetical protein